MLRTSTYLSYLFVLIVISGQAFAFEWFDINLGLGVNRYDNIRKGNTKRFLKNDPVYEPIPTVQLRIGPIFINKDGGGVALLYYKNVKLVGMFLYEGEAYRANGMEERKQSFYFGGGLKIYDLESIYYQDVQGRSNGKAIKVTYVKEFVFSKYTFAIRPSVQYWDKKYVDYFYGVRPEEVDLSIDRTLYTGKSTLNYGIDLRNVWKSSRVQYVLSAGYKFYSPEVYDSPTVSRKKEMRVLAGFLFKIY